MYRRADCMMAKASARTKVPAKPSLSPQRRVQRAIADLLTACELKLTNPVVEETHNELLSRAALALIASSIYNFYLYYHSLAFTALVGYSRIVASIQNSAAGVLHTRVAAVLLVIVGITVGVLITGPA